MKPSLLLLTALAAAFTVRARAEVRLYEVKGGAEIAVAPVYQFGTLNPGEPASAQFRLRNMSDASAPVSLLRVTGMGFALAGAPPLPVVLAPRGATDFTVNFRAGETGTYSAGLQSEGISVVLIASVPTRLTPEVESQQGFQPLTTAGVSFGEVEIGYPAALQFQIVNRTSVLLSVPALAVTGDRFTLREAAHGTPLEPGQSAAFEIRFDPTSTGPRNGLLTIGDRGYTLAATGIEPRLPKPKLEIRLDQTRSAQQGSVSIGFDAPARARGAGKLTIAFQPAATLPADTNDSAIAFSNGTRIVEFPVERGQSGVQFDGGTPLFQTGSTAGSLVFTVQIGDYSDQRTISISPAPVGVTATRAVRTSTGVEVLLTGYDNTRSAGSLSFTFFDGSGTAVSPGAIRVEAAPEFTKYFSGSELGGVFQIRAVFPITGDASRVASVEAQITNSSGVGATPRTSF